MHPDEPFSCRVLCARPASQHQLDQPRSLMHPKWFRGRSVIKAHLKVLSSAIVARCSKRLAPASWLTARLALQVGVNSTPRKQTESGALSASIAGFHPSNGPSTRKARLDRPVSSVARMCLGYLEAGRARAPKISPNCLTTVGTCAQPPGLRGHWYRGS